MTTKCGLKINNCQTITPNIWTILQLRHFFYSHKRGQPNYLWGPKKNIENKLKKRNLILKITEKLFRITLLLCIGIFNRLIDFLNVGDSLMLEVTIKK